MAFRELGRKDCALDREQIVQILNREKRGVLSVCGENGYPYGLPINYWYNEENGYLYFHSGRKGHKIDAIDADNKVSFCVYDEGFKKEGEWALNISSVIVFGTLHLVEDQEKAADVYRSLSLKFHSDLEHINAQIAQFAHVTRCYELRPAHIAGKIVCEE